MCVNHECSPTVPDGLVSQYRSSTFLTMVGAGAVFTVAFINKEFALYLLIFSMLLSPEFIVGETSEKAIGRGITLRLDDFLLVIIGLSWFAKNAVHKDLGLFRRFGCFRSLKVGDIANCG